MAYLFNDNPRAPGSGDLAIALSRRRSVVTRAYATSPLRLLTPRSFGDAAWVYTGSYGGGLVGGDALRLRVRVGAAARAFVSTQAATKVYRSDAATSVALDATVASGGLLVVWPDPVVCFAGGTYDQRQRVDLEAAASLVLVDGMSSGRRASGERWLFDRYSTRLTVRRDGAPVLFDSVRLAQDDGPLAARMGRFDVLGTIALVGPAVQDHAREIVSAIAALEVRRKPDMLVAAAPLAGGCVVRLAAGSVEQAAQLQRRVLAFVPRLLGDDPWARKW